LCLDAKEWHLLRLLLNICLRDEAGKPSQNVAVNMLAVLDLGDCIKVAMSAGQGGTDGLDEVLMACNKSQFKDLTPDTVHMFFEAVQDVLGVPTPARSL
jgi:hypothetical protein